MAEQNIGGVVVVKVTAEDKAEFKRRQKDRMREFAELLESTPIDWDGSMGKMDSIDEAVQGHKTDREAKLIKGDWS